MNKILLLIGAISFLNVSCKKIPVASHGAFIQDTLLSEFKPSKTTFKYLATKTKIEFSDGINIDQYAMTLRVKKDSVIWASIGKAGIEGVRALLRPDSVFILDKMKNDSYSYDLNYLKGIIQSDLSYENFQNLLVGDLLIDYNSKTDKITKNDTCFILNQQKDHLTIESFIRFDNLKVEKVLIVDVVANVRTNVQYSNFIIADSILMYSVCAMNIAYVKDEKKQYSQLTLTHNKIELSAKPLNFPFNIPKKYNEK
jgi:hypothetical protein